MRTLWRRPVDVVLVTGTPRSGTTVVGDVLAEAPGVRYLYEPLNRWVGVRDLDQDFPVPGSSIFETAQVGELIERISRVDLSLKPGLFPHDKGWRRVAKRFVGSRTTMSYRMCRIDPRLRTVIWKDPFAICMAGDVAAAGVPVVVTVRNPWAVAASFKRLGWSFDVGDLHRRLAEAGRTPTLDPSTLDDRRDPVTNAAILWTMAHEGFLAEAERGRKLSLVDLDHIVDQPVAAYRGLFRDTGLEWTERIEARIRDRYRNDAAASGPAPTSGRAHDWKARDVSQVNRYWADVLTEVEVDRVESLAGEVWGHTKAACESIG